MPNVMNHLAGYVVNRPPARMESCIRQPTVPRRRNSKYLTLPSLLKHKIAPFNGTSSTGTFLLSVYERTDESGHRVIYKLLLRMIGSDSHPIGQRTYRAVA